MFDNFRRIIISNLEQFILRSLTAFYGTFGFKFNKRLHIRIQITASYANGVDKINKAEFWACLSTVHIIYFNMQEFASTSNNHSNGKT